MTLHIVTVVYQDDAQFREKYSSCDLIGWLGVRLWIFVKRLNDALSAK